MPFAPVGIYDYTNRLVTTVESDFNGLYDVLLPSTNRISCPTPSGVCANLYRFVGNDPGVPGRLNPNYNPQLPDDRRRVRGVPGPASCRPTSRRRRSGVTVQLPGAADALQVTCALDATHARSSSRSSEPYVTSSGDRHFTIDGPGLRRRQGTAQVTLDGTTSLRDRRGATRRSTVTVPAATPPGRTSSTITPDNGQSTVNGLTFHVWPGYNPHVLRGRPRQPQLQPRTAPAPPTTHPDALDARRPNDSSSSTRAPDLANPRINPRGAYYENLIIDLAGQAARRRPGRLPDGNTFVPRLDHRRRRLRRRQPSGDRLVDQGRRADLGRQPDRQRRRGDLRSSSRTPTSAYRPPVRQPTSRPASTASTSAAATSRASPATSTRSAAARPACRRTSSPRAARSSPTPTPATCRSPTTWCRTTAAATGRSASARPDLPAPDTNQHNENAAHRQQPHHRQRRHQPGRRHRPLRRRDSYDVAGNDICGNFSAEYGGGISAYGLSPNGKIHHNRIYFNQSYDEGGGIMIAGELPAEPGDALARHRPGRHLQQPDPGEPGQRRRRRHALPDGRATSR